MTIPVSTDSFTWSSKAAAKADFKRIMNSYAPEVPIDDQEDDAKLREILERHPDYDDKVGVGIDYFFVDFTSKGDRFNVRPDATGIWIKRTDGTVVDFSYITCVDQHTDRSDAKEGLRAAVESRRLEYRQNRFDSGAVTSDLSGEVLHTREQASVIYLEPTWEQLTFAFVNSEGGWANVLVHGGHGEVKIGSALIDPQVERRWLVFFDANAKMGLAFRSEAARRKRSDEAAWTP